ncbi:hypothetical protein BTVI_136967 [Pitangus sulphuratus]|nr:hypothetical protein BTVI_136967 [Pitangus sulphuratus]
MWAGTDCCRELFPPRILAATGPGLTRKTLGSGNGARPGCGSASTFALRGGGGDSSVGRAEEKARKQQELGEAWSSEEWKMFHSQAVE